MKKIFPFIMLFIFFFSALSAQSSKEKKDPSGQWKFDAPYAPEGYTSGTVDIGFTDKKYSATMSFTNLGYAFTGEKVRAQNDSLFFLVWIEGNDVSVSLKMNDKTTMAGNAVYYGGVVPLTLTKEPEKK